MEPGGLELAVQQRLTLNARSSCLHLPITGMAAHPAYVVEFLNIHSELLLSCSDRNTGSLFYVHTIFFSELQVCLGKLGIRSC